MNFRLDAACVCHAGLIKKSNEDNLLFFDESLPPERELTTSSFEKQGTMSNGTFLAVFDGVSGAQHGEIASHTAAMHLRSVRKRHIFERKQNYLKKIIQNMNAFVHQKAVELNAAQICTTVVGLYITKSKLWVFNVGDSRAFFMRSNKLTQISIDDTNRSYLLKQGRPDKKPRLIQYLGVDPSVMRIAPHISPNRVIHGDIFLLCSDGLTDMLTENEMLHILSKNCSASNTANALVQAALERGGKDNITVIVCKIFEK